MKDIRKYHCPNCGSILECIDRKNHRFKCNNCSKQYIEKINMLFQIIELFILLKLVNLISYSLADKMTFIANKEPISFMIGLLLVVIYSYIVARNMDIKIKLHGAKLIETDNRETD